MSIRTVVTRGYGNGTFDGTIALVVVRGYGVEGEAAFGTLRMRQIKALKRSATRAQKTRKRRK